MNEMGCGHPYLGIETVGLTAGVRKFLTHHKEGWRAAHMQQRRVIAFK